MLTDILFLCYFIPNTKYNLDDDVTVGDADSDTEDYLVQKTRTQQSWVSAKQFHIHDYLFSLETLLQTPFFCNQGIQQLLLLHTHIAAWIMLSKF